MATDCNWLPVVFWGVHRPLSMEKAADVDGSVGVNISDITYMADYLFGGGPAPVCEEVFTRQYNQLVAGESGRGGLQVRTLAPAFWPGLSTRLQLLQMM